MASSGGGGGGGGGEGWRTLMMQIMSVTQRGPHTFCDFDQYISQMGFDLQVLLLLEPVAGVLRAQLEAWQTDLSHPVPFETPVMQTFFLNLPSCLLPTALCSSSNNQEEDGGEYRLDCQSRNVFEHLFALLNSAEARQEYARRTVNVLCEHCAQPTHRGHCLVARTEDEFDHFRVTFALGPVFTWLDRLKRVEEHKVLLWISSRYTQPPHPRELEIELQQCLQQAEDTLEEVAFLMSGVVNDVMEVNVYGNEDEAEGQLTGEEIDMALDQFVDYVEESCGGLLEKLNASEDVGAIEAEHDLICEDVLAMQKAIRQLQEKLRGELELDGELARLQRAKKDCEADFKQCESRLAASQAELAAVRAECARKLTALQLHADAASEAKHVQQELALARQLRVEAQERLAEAEQQTAQLAAQQRRRLPCITCRDREATGVLHPCKRHFMCVECFRQHQSRVLVGAEGSECLPSLCPACVVRLTKIDFATFEFDFKTGRERYKV